jgi:serine phosphatase RsbU (regulator of sigma subunit)
VLAQRQRLIVLSGLSGGWSDVTELLEQVRRDLAADEASLLMMDTTGSMLIPVASSGLDTPAGFRVPIGAGFAGRVAATGRPLMLAEVTADNVLDPAVHRRGIRSLLGVPVSGRSGLLGVMHVGSIAARTFSEADTRQLRQAASRLADDVSRRRASEEHIAALVLQRSLLPTRSPRIAGLDLAARYIPADGDLGGDWYDVFQLPGERIGIVMGDVAGHGLAAAVVMGRLRSALRAYALEHDDPAEVLRLLDMKISYFEAGAVATVLYAVADPPYDRFTISCAGHLPPFLIPVEGATQPVPMPADPPMGVRGSWTRHTTTVQLPVGASLCLFTDGLVERRPTDEVTVADQLTDGIERLRTALRAGDPDTACSDVLTDLLGDDVTEDDVALLIVRRTGS